MNTKTLQENVKNMKLQNARKAKGLTQKELAEKTGVSLRTLQHYEQGSKDLNTAAAITVYTIAIALGLTVEELLDFDKVRNELERLAQNNE